MRRYALIVGIIYLLVGLAGLVPGLLVAMPEDPLRIETLHGRLFGLFPVNIVHDGIHILVGLWGIAAFRNFEGAKIYARSLAVIFGILTVMGFFPMLNRTFGLAPIHGPDVAIHAATAVLSAMVGWGAVKKSLPPAAPYEP
ncbi:MAG: hypothetical protein JWM91_3348 [Rhodospirillales bacterium]|nr:hypothetical protein [Rhodospirillales bacterium]